MNYQSRLARIARYAARKRVSNHLIRSRMLEWTNLAVGEGVLPRVGSDAIIDSFDKLLESIGETKELDLAFASSGDQLLNQQELWTLVGVKLAVLLRVVDASFAGKITNRHYEPARKIIVLPIVRRSVA